MLPARYDDDDDDDVKTKIDKTQQSSKCILYGVKEKTVNHIASECNKPEQKE